ncbi:MAG: 6-pyruvoyl-tetrahydropterin synthase-related protein [Candidatus Parcubacteria bacterium]|nr:6-pyruvoyl-tetrahydropterin synthase-related protein [Candidatus Parcubacteria bacterium]
MKNKLNFLLPIVIVAVFGVIAGFSLLHKGLLPTHDGEYHVVRFFLFNEALWDGILYPRWAAHLNNGFGVPLFNFVYPLPNYISSMLHLFNISFIDSFKISMFVATILGGIFFYLWSREFWGRLGGIVSSVFYTFSPYHFVDIYIRGSVGEVWALAFFPAFLWAFTKFVKSKQKTFLVLSSIFLALIILSHNILALMFFVFALSYIVFLICIEKNKKNLVLNTLCLIFLGLGLSAIFWFPALYETKYVTGLQIFDVTSHFPDLYQLLIPSWGSGFSGAGIQNELSYQIGAANLLAIFLSVVVIILQIKRKDKKKYYSLFFLLWFLLVFFLMLEKARFVWQLVPFMNYFQFPWRLLSLEILFTSFLAGCIFSLNIKIKFINYFFAVFLIFIAFILGIDYAKPAYYMYRDDGYYTSRPNFINGTNSPGNVFNTIYLNSIPAKERQRAIFTKGKGKIRLNKAKSNLYKFTIHADTNSEIQINLAYFPGWEVYVNGKKEHLGSTQNGRITFLVLEGESEVEIIFKDTLVRKLSVLISIISLGLITALLINERFVTIRK